MPDAVAFAVHSAKAPYTEICKAIAPKLHFEFAMVAHDKRANEVKDASEVVAVLYTVDYHVTPCQMVKVPLSVPKKVETYQALTVPICFKDTDIFTNCFMVDNS